MEILIHWPDTAPAFLFVCDTYFFLPPPQGCTLHSNVCHINSQTKTHNSLLFFFFFFFNRTNYCGANPDCCCHGNCLSGGYGATKAQVTESERKWEEVKICEGDTHTAHCVPTYFMFHLVSWRVLLAVYLDSKWSDHGAAPRQCQKMNLMWVSGDKCSFSTEPSAKRSQSRDPLPAIYPLH